MEMNRYLLAALYVMAGCAVVVPLKAQNNYEPLRGERCRLVITNTVKAVSICLEEEDSVWHSSELPPDYYYFPKTGFFQIIYSFSRTVRMNPGPLCRSARMIRAPENMISI